MSTPSHETRLRGALKAIADERSPEAAMAAAVRILANAYGMDTQRFVDLSLHAMALDVGAEQTVDAALNVLAAMDGLDEFKVALLAIRWGGGIMGPKEAGPVLGCDPSNIGQVRAVYSGPTEIGKASGHSLYIGSDVHRTAERRRNGEGRSRRGRRPAIAPPQWTPPEERAVS
jgi:hypothetical protein